MFFSSLAGVMPGTNHFKAWLRYNNHSALRQASAALRGWNDGSIFANANSFKRTLEYDTIQKRILLYN